MQEEVNQKTVALSIRTTKLTGKVLAAALGKVARALQKHHRKALTPQGRQSVKKLMNHYGGKSTMPYVGAPKDFDRIAKEFHVDYAFHKVSPGHYLLFFKANQADAITAAFQKYSAKVLNKEQDKASILGQLRKFTEQIRTQAKEKQRTREAVKDGRRVTRSENMCSPTCRPFLCSGFSPKSVRPTVSPPAQTSGQSSWGCSTPSPKPLKPTGRGWEVLTCWWALPVRLGCIC